MRGPLLRVVVGILTVVSALGVSPRAPAAGPFEEWGYIPLADGTHLRYDVVRPAEAGQYPVALIFSPYADGNGPLADFPTGEDPQIARTLLGAGYAVLGVNMRGTGCSSGDWDLFQPASDGYEVVEWAGTQGWSSGHVGMFGFSGPGISQLLTAATKPPHLDAITPNEVTTDIYRDVAFPGGIMNPVFSGFWTLAYHPAISALGAQAAAQGDDECLRNMAGRNPAKLGQDFLTLAQHPYDDEVWAKYDPGTTLADIDIPVLSCGAWQDDQVSSHAMGDFPNQLKAATTWMVLTNGHHGTCDDYASSPFQDLIVRFFDRYVKGTSNGFEQGPHVRIWHETTVSPDATTVVPSWVTEHPQWPVPVGARALYLRSRGRLDPLAPGAREIPSGYAYPLPASSMEDQEFSEPYQAHAGWKVNDAPGGSVAFTSAPVTTDLEVFGPASADLWVRSTATDTDLQVTLTEVRADGQEVYLTRGWLRASRRALDSVRSTELRPYHTHSEADAAPLTPGEPALLRVELNAVGHVFRAGSAIRLIVDAPTGLTGIFGFDYLKTPAVNAVLHDAGHPSRLVLGVVTGGAAPVGNPACDTVISEPCRAA